jgi:hypothetical protein
VAIHPAAARWRNGFPSRKSRSPLTIHLHDSPSTAQLLGLLAASVAIDARTLWQ